MMRDFFIDLVLVIMCSSFTPVPGLCYFIAGKEGQRTEYWPNEMSTGPNGDPLSLQISYLKMLYSGEGGQLFHGLNFITEQYFTN